MKALHIGITFFCLSDHVERAGGWVDHRCAGDADDRNDVDLVADVCAVHHASACSGPVRGVKKSDAPKWGSIGGWRIAVGIESVNAVVLGGDEYHVVLRASLGCAGAHGYSWNIKRLRVNVAVHRVGEELSELTGTHIGRREDSFTGVGAGTGDIVMLREHRDLRHRAPPK